MVKKNTKNNKSSYLAKLENLPSPIVNSSNSPSYSNSNIDSLLIADMSYIESINTVKSVLSKIAVVTEDELKAYWTMIMCDSRVSVKDRLTASKLLAQAHGMFDKGKTVASVGGAVYKWRTSTVEAEIVQPQETTQESKGECNTLGDKAEEANKEV